MKNKKLQLPLMLVICITALALIISSVSITGWTQEQSQETAPVKYIKFKSWWRLKPTADI